MMEISKLICITCPKGCTLQVSHEGKTVVDVKDGCKRGHEYAEEELADPRRMVATTVRIKDSLHPLLPVYTASPFPKPLIFALLNKLRTLEVQAPVKSGQVIMEDALSTGVDVLASRSMDPA